MKKAKIEKLIKKHNQAIFQHSQISGILEDELIELESAIDYHEDKNLSVFSECSSYYRRVLLPALFGGAGIFWLKF
jgi:hypothetical protein